MASVDLEYNQGFKIYKGNTWFNNLVLHKATYETVVMSLGDKISGIVYYKNNKLVVDMTEYIMYKDVKYVLVNPPTVIKEGLVSDNGELKGMTKYSFTFYHPMYMLSNFPFSDVAVDDSQKQYLSQNKTFSWIGNLVDYKDKLNKNLEGTQWKVSIGTNVTDAEKNKLSEVLSFDNNTIADALKTAYETWEIPYIVDKVEAGTQDYLINRKRFVVQFGLPSDKIYKKDKNGNFVLDDNNQKIPFVFKYGQGVGLKNNSRTPKNNKIVTRIAGYGSEDNIPYGYPQIVWTGNQDWNYTINNDSTAANSYPIYDGIVGGQKVRLIKHPFTRTHLMPPIYKETVNKKVNPNATGYNPNTELVDYYDAVNTQGETWENPIIQGQPSYEIHTFEDIKPELGDKYLAGVTSYDNNTLKAISMDSFLTLLDDYYSESENGDEKDAILHLKNSITENESDEEWSTLSRTTYKYAWKFTSDSYFKYVTFQSSILNFQNTILINSSVVPAPEWDDTMDDDGKYVQSYFKVTLPVLGFDLYACAAITQEMTINMRSGACIGCSFPVMVDWDDYKRNFYDKDGNFAPTGTQRNYTKYPNSTNNSITLILQKETNTFGTLMPNIYQKPARGDKFVILGISLPTLYITTAEGKLETEMKKYMRDNNVYYYEYPLKFDEHFLISNEHILSQMKPNVIVNFEYANVEQSLYIKQMSIKYNESPLPKYDITLTDDVDVVLNKIGEAIAEYRGQRQYGNGGGNSETLDGNKFLRKDINDTASGTIRMLKGLQVGERFVTGLLGEGGIFRKDDDGTTYLECDRMYVRMKAYFDTVEVRRFIHSGGNRVASAAGIKCSRVEYYTQNNLTTTDASDAAYFRCYFRANDNGTEITNDFEINDLAYCKETNKVGEQANTTNAVATRSVSSNRSVSEENITISLVITNNTNASVTLDGEARLVLSNPDVDGTYHGWNGSYNRTDRIVFSNSAVTLAVGESRTVTLSGELYRRSPAGDNALAEAGSRSNVILYVGGVSEVVLCSKLSSSIVFQNGGTYNVSLAQGGQGISQRFYWRKVIGVSSAVTLDGEHYIDLSATDCATGSDVPIAQDDIIQLGNTIDTKRQGAIIEFVSGEDAPSYQIYQGINTYNLDNKNYIGLGYSSNKGRAYMNVYGDFYFGSKNESTYIKYNSGAYNPSTNPDGGKLKIKAVIEASSTIGGTETTTTIGDILSDIDELQRQIDGAIETWFYDYMPVEKTQSGAPANRIPLTTITIDGQTVPCEPYYSWYTADHAGTAQEVRTERAKHLGDMFYDNSTGYAFRFSLNENTNAFEWVEITDSAVIEALRKAAEAYNLADTKNKIFTTAENTLPPVPYKTGDLWVNATGTFTYTEDGQLKSVTYSNDILKCVQSRDENASGSRSITDWVLASKYTDDTLVEHYTNLLTGAESPQQGATDKEIALAAENAIRSALGGKTILDGGLMLTSILALRKLNHPEDDPDDPDNYTTYAGISGVYDQTLYGGGIAAWYGGGMVDKRNATTGAYDVANGAKSGFRFDGSGWLANGNITWDAQGRVAIKDITTLVGGNDTDILNALTTFNNAFHFTTSPTQQSTILNINPQYAFSHLEIYDVNGNHAVATTDYVNENFVTKAFFNRLFQAYSNEDHTDAHKVNPNEATAINNLKILVGAWTDQYLSAKGINPQQSGGGGVGDVTWDLLASSSDTNQIALSHLTDALTNYATQSWVTLQGFLKTHQTLYTLSVYGGTTNVLSFKPNANASLYIKASGDISLTPDTTNHYITLSYSHPTGGADITISEASGKVLSAITVNNLGHVTSVSSKTLEAVDIPNLAASKITSGTFDAARIPDLSATYATSTQVSTLEGYFTSGVANSASKLSDNTACTAWGQTFFNNGKPVSVANTYMSGVTKIDDLLYFSNGNVGIGTDSPNYKFQAILDSKGVSFKTGEINYTIFPNSSSDTAGMAVYLPAANNWFQFLSIGTPEPSSGARLYSIGYSTVRHHTNIYGVNVRLYSCNDNGDWIQTLGTTKVGNVIVGYSSGYRSDSLLSVNGDIFTNRIYFYRPTQNSDEGAIYVEKVTVDNINYLKLNGNFYATGSVSALGANTGGGGGGGVGDVTWDLLASEATNNRTIHSSYIQDALTSLGYATQLWVNNQGFLKSIPTASSYNKGGVKVGNTLAISSEVLNLKSGVATAGTYYKATVDTYGRVTGGSTSLAASDIPDLSATYATSTRVSTLEGYFTSGVANSASKLSDNTACTAWGQTFFNNGKPVSVANTYMSGVTGINSLLYFNNSFVGIGTDSPEYKLHVDTDDSGVVFSTNDYKLRLAPQTSANTASMMLYWPAKSSWFQLFSLDTSVASSGTSNILAFGYSPIRHNTEIYGTNVRLYSMDDSNNWIRTLGTSKTGHVIIGYDTGYRTDCLLNVNGDTYTQKLYLYKPNTANDENAIFFTVDTVQTTDSSGNTSNKKVLKLNGDFYATGSVSALGASSGGSSGGGVDLHDPLSSIHSQLYSNPTQNNAILIYSKSNGWYYDTFNKSSYLTTTYSLTVNCNSTEALTYTPSLQAKTLTLKGGNGISLSASNGTITISGSTPTYRTFYIKSLNTESAASSVSVINYTPSDSDNKTLTFKALGDITLDTETSNQIGIKYELPTASSTTKGGVKVGTGLSISKEILSIGSGVAVLGTAQTFTAVHRFNDDTWYLNGAEHCDIHNRQWDNGTLRNNNGTVKDASFAIRNAVEFRWYDTYWDIGNIRSSDTSSYGFGIAYRNESDSFVRDCLRVTPTGDLFITGNGYVFGTQPAVHVGTDYNNFIALHWSSDGNRGLYGGGWIIGYNGTNTYLNNGNVGIGTVSPSQKLEVNGNVKATKFYLTDQLYFEVDGTSIKCNGDFYATGAVSALGANSGSGGGGGVGDVTWDLLASNSDTHQIAASHLNVLNGYAQQSWVTSQGYLTSSALSSYVTTNTEQNITAKKTFTVQQAFTVASGSPFTVTSSTIVTNLNADKLDGQDGSYYATASGLSTLQGFFTGGVANSAAQLSDTSEYKAWGQTFFTGGKPTSISDAPLSGVTNVDLLLYFDIANSRIGIGSGNSSPAYTLDVNGTIRVGTDANLIAEHSTTSKYMELSSAGNEILISGAGSSSLTMHVNYRTSLQTSKYVPVEWQWHNGSSDSWTKFILGSLEAKTSIKIGGATLTWVSGQGLKCDENFYSEKAISALGSNSQSGGGGVGDVTWDALATTATGGRTIHHSYIDDAVSSYGYISQSSADNRYIMLNGTSSITGDLIPVSTASNLWLGSSSYHWTEGHIDNIYMNSTNNNSKIEIAGAASTLTINATSINNPAATLSIQNSNDARSLSLCSGGGNVGVGTSPNSSYKLYVNGNTYLNGLLNVKDFFIQNSGPNYYNIGGNGLTVYQNGTWTGGSDIRRKDIVTNIGCDINQIASAPIFNFIWKADITRTVHVGTSAQYWSKVFENAVSEGGDGYLYMDYGATALASAVITARKVLEHEGRIRLLEIENQALRKEIEQLKKAA